MSQTVTLLGVSAPRTPALLTAGSGRRQQAADKLQDRLLHVQPVLRVPWCVALAGEEQQLVALARGNQPLYQARRVSEVHVLVDQTVHQQQRALWVGAGR